MMGVSIPDITFRTQRRTADQWITEIERMKTRVIAMIPIEMLCEMSYDKNSRW